MVSIVLISAGAFLLLGFAVAQIASVGFLRRFADRHSVQRAAAGVQEIAPQTESFQSDVGVEQEVGTEIRVSECTEGVANQGVAAIVLALRGADPHLADGLERLLTQDYPSHRLVVVVDHEDDPSRPMVQRVVEKYGPDRVELQVLEHRMTTCGLKCSALVQAVERLTDEVEYVVFADADVVAHDQWLSALVAPLRDPKVGLVTGAQWFEPPDQNWGSWIRSIWNSGASVPTIMLNHPWAGSCALRRTDLLRSGLVERWRNSMVDDGPMAGAISELGLELRFLSEAWMVNRESCSLRFVCRYMKRMLTWSRLYESTYLITVAHAVLTAGLFWGLAIAGPILAVRGYGIEAILACGSVLLFWLASIFGYRGVRDVVRPFAEDRGEKLGRESLGRIFKLALGIPMTYAIYAWAAVSALWVRKIEWRGVEYEITDGHDVRVSHYEPFRPQAAASHSL